MLCTSLLNLPGALMVHFRYLVLLELLVMPQYLSAETIQLPDFNEFNRGINSGSQISRDNQYLGQPTDRLLYGVKSPIDTHWESHSTLTTGLFLINTQGLRSQNKRVYFHAQSKGLAQKHSMIWVAVRYFDRHGLLIDEKVGDKFEVFDQWQEMSVPLEVSDAHVVYTEVWFVKFKDADQMGKTKHPIYLSAIQIR